MLQYKYIYIYLDSSHHQHHQSYPLHSSHLARLLVEQLTGHAARCHSSIQGGQGRLEAHGTYVFGQVTQTLGLGFLQGYLSRDEAASASLGDKWIDK